MIPSGTPDSPISIRENYIQGAYTIKPWQKNETRDGWSYGWGFSGGGIMLGDGKDSDSATRDPTYVRARDNVVIDTTNYGIALAAGHDLLAHDNRILSTGRLPDGRFIAAQISEASFPGARWTSLLAFDHLPRIIRDDLFRDTVTYPAEAVGFNGWTAAAVIAVAVVVSAIIVRSRYRRLA